jgi:hypothetical protein
MVALGFEAVKLAVWQERAVIAESGQVHGGAE